MDIINQHLAVKNFESIYICIENNPRLTEKNIEEFLDTVKTKQSKVETLYLMMEKCKFNENSFKSLLEIIKNKKIKNLYLGMQRVEFNDDHVERVKEVVLSREFDNLYLGFSRQKGLTEKSTKTYREILRNIKCGNLRFSMAWNKGVDSEFIGELKQVVIENDDIVKCRLNYDTVKCA